MIFVTVGSALPFDRLIKGMDDCARRHPDMKMFAQIGQGQYEPRHMLWKRMIGPGEFRQRVAEARLIVAHAGMGSVFTAREHGKPIVLVPRYQADHEHTTDHQVHTANWLEDRPGIGIARKEDDLDAKIEEMLKIGEVREAFSATAPEPFLIKLREALRG